ncbi:hypothetical protein [Streptomyces benahoarensis]|uniref:Uncharacterized protein n=1 Tax=Streptomyces benahoarensis TaxID=2595054 RepID=A0A553ZNA3_9ACTN|nr:hypothetical protein [Streptomyces benahoarensis]TSB26119.1 hypothetical protein FNJ62_11575 [Streptomyces benahoarensis]TSB42893.1 hypothetical protein FNZ23_07440 [Streptomyces benahoarensis]
MDDRTFLARLAQIPFDADAYEKKRAEEAAAKAARRPRVIARYLTDAGKALSDPGLNVTVTEINHDERGGGVYATFAQCTGCPDGEKFHWDDGLYGYGMTHEESVERAADRARDWAQGHAETCRAMTCPDAA